MKETTESIICALCVRKIGFTTSKTWNGICPKSNTFGLQEWLKIGLVSLQRIE